MVPTVLVQVDVRAADFTLHFVLVVGLDNVGGIVYILDMTNTTHPESTAYSVERIAETFGIYSEHAGRYIAVLADQDTAERFAGRLNALDLIHGAENDELEAVEAEARATARAQGVD